MIQPRTNHFYITNRNFIGINNGDINDQDGIGGGAVVKLGQQIIIA